MSGGIIRAKGRNRWRVWVPWKGKKLWINRYLDGSPLYHEAQATRVIEKIRAEIDQGTFDPASWGKDRPMQIREAWRIYSEQSPCGIPRATQRDRIFEKFILPYFKDLSIRDIRTIDIQDWFSKLPPDMTPSYKRVVKATLRAFMYFHSDSLIKFPKFPKVSVPRKAVPWITREEQERVMDAVKPHNRGVIRFLVTYGCRPSEVCHLRKSDIDWQRKEIAIRGRKNGEDLILPLVPEIEAVLREPRRVQSLEYVFCTTQGNPYLRQTLNKIWNAACKAAGIRPIALKNGTRHSKACQLINQDVSLESIARILGNSRAVVERSYGRVSVGRVAEVLKVHAMDTMGRN